MFRSRLFRFDAASLVVIALVLAACAGAARLPVSVPPTDFSGEWRFDAARSDRAEALRTLDLVVRIVQHRDSIRFEETYVAQGKTTVRTATYDLTGRMRMNDASVGGPSETVARWRDGALVVQWTSHDGPNGAARSRMETRRLSPDGQVMTVQSLRDEPGAQSFTLAFVRLGDR